jgi:hypothetical protein
MLKEGGVLTAIEGRKKGRKAVTHTVMGGRECTSGWERRGVM